MPRRNDIDSILVIGAGPIIIGQACEFDYSGSQACKALKKDGFRVVLVNSNPATIMTDPETAHKTYIEPITPEVIKKIIIKEKVSAVLPTIGGQTGLNAAVQVAEDGFLQKHNVELIGADIEAIEKAEDRDSFCKAMHKIGLQTTRSGIAYSLQEAMAIIKDIAFPVIIRAAYTLGGTGGSIAYNLDEFKELVQKGIDLSMVGEVMIEQSILGWKEYELEVMRDTRDNVIIICSIENLDPMGIHTGDSITVAPQQTLSDKEYQRLRDMSIAIIREIGVETGGSNIQFAVNPENGEVIVIEMNPRVSRSSALASKATGFPIAKIAALLAVGYTLDEIANDITRSTPASFEPMIDYVVTKIPRFTFEKFSSSASELGIQMRSVGETMSIGRTFKESLQKGIRGMETGRYGFDGIYFSYKKLNQARVKQKTLADMKADIDENIITDIKRKLESKDCNRIYYLKDAFYAGLDMDEIYRLTAIDKWFLANLKEIYDLEQRFYGTALKSLDKEALRQLKAAGFSDYQIAFITGSSENEVRAYRQEQEVLNNFKIVDTCAAEFKAETPYYYSCYDEETEVKPPAGKNIIILGGGPNRIGQGIEFDYMCVKASFALQEMGYRSIMINSNPETVSTDYDVSNILYFEPVVFENVMDIVEQMQPEGVITQLGGQTPLNNAQRLEQNRVAMVGTSAASIAIAEDREQFKQILNKHNFKQPANATAFTGEEACKIAADIGFPVLIRPSYVLGGRAMEIVYDKDELIHYVNQAIDISSGQPILIDKYLEKAIEIDVDCICDGEDVVICGIMEHIEEAGIHSGDSACILPPQHIPAAVLKTIKKQTREMAFAMNVKGLMNVQYAVKDDTLYFLEVNPRGSRTVPFISKATGVPWIKYAVKVMAGHKIKDINIREKKINYVAVKEAVLPFDKFPDEDILLSPEMKSTGEVMGIGMTLGEAYYKAQLAAGVRLPQKGGVLVTVKTRDYPEVIEVSRHLSELGFTIYCTEGTGAYLRKQKVENTFVHKVGDGRPDIRDLILNKKIGLIFNTPIGKREKATGRYIRLLAKQHKIPIMTTTGGMTAAVNAIREMYNKDFDVKAIQDYYK